MKNKFNVTFLQKWKSQKLWPDNNNLYHSIKDQWDPVENSEPFPEDPAKHKHIVGKWRCEKGHFWYETIENRATYQKCHVCYSPKLATEIYNLYYLRPDISKEWHPTKNKGLTPYDATPGSSKKVWWECHKKHAWFACIADRNIVGIGCPECANKRAGKDNNLAILRPDLAAEWDYGENGDLTPYNVVLGSHKIVGWKCLLKQHKWKTQIRNRAMGSGCLQCYLERKRSEKK